MTGYFRINPFMPAFYLNNKFTILITFGTKKISVKAFALCVHLKFKLNYEQIYDIRWKPSDKIKNVENFSTHQIHYSYRRR